MLGYQVCACGLIIIIIISLIFMSDWQAQIRLRLLGKGHFFYRGQVEDSATAEISRSQVGMGLKI